MQRTEHLADVVDRFGPAFATGTIVDLIEEGLRQANALEQERRAEEKGTTKKLNPYVTDVGKCERAVVKSLRNDPESDPLTTDSLINFGVGHAVEDWLTRILEVQGATVLREVRLEIPLEGVSVPVSGRADFLVTIPEAKLLIELKTTSSRAMGYMIRNGHQGRDEHRRQLNLYLHASHLGIIGDEPFETGLLVYVVKDGVKGEPVAHAFDITYDAFTASTDLLLLGQLARQADRGEIPQIPDGYKKNKFPCGYCAFRKACWG